MRRLLLSAVALAAATCASHAQRESPADMRRIVAQALCLAEAYPDGPLAADAIIVVDLYLPRLDGLTQADAQKVRALARALAPSTPTPVGARNLALAKCALFADDPQVKRALRRGR